VRTWYLAFYFSFSGPNLSPYMKNVSSGYSVMLFNDAANDPDCIASNVRWFMNNKSEMYGRKRSWLHLNSVCQEYLRTFTPRQDTQAHDGDSNLGFYEYETGVLTTRRRQENVLRSGIIKRTCTRIATTKWMHVTEVVSIGPSACPMFHTIEQSFVNFCTGGLHLEVLVIIFPV
jgi:hypothetical protein